MVQHQRQLDTTLAALADPTRRRILERLGHGDATITQLAQPFQMSLTGMKKHVRILEDAGLVQTEKTGRMRRCSLAARRLEDLEQWIASYRRMLDGRLERLATLLEDEERPSAEEDRAAGDEDRAAAEENRAAGDEERPTHDKGAQRCPPRPESRSRR